MAPKRKGPLQLLQREADQLKRQVDSLAKSVHGSDGGGAGGGGGGGGGGTGEAFQRCQQLQRSAQKTLVALRKLTKADELAPVGNYDLRKQEEEARLEAIVQRLNFLSEQLSALPLPAGDGSQDESEEDEDEDEEAEDVSHGGSDRKDGGSDRKDGGSDRKDGGKPITCVALIDFSAEQDGDLSVRKGEVLTIIRMTADGWWLAEDEQGNRGVVPRTFLERRPGAEAEDEEDEDEVEDEDEECSDEEEGEMEDDELPDSSGKHSSSHSKWSTVRRALNEMDTADVLSAMGAIPAEFRASTLNKLLTEDVTYRGSRYVQPELSQSQLSFKDLFLEPETGRVRARQVRVCVCFALWRCRMIPPPGVGLQVLSRHVRVCAFDGAQVLSNIHTVRATFCSKNPKTWSFSPRTAGVLPTLLDADLFLRSNSDSAELGLLFELGVSFIRNSTGERGELSCGWSYLKLTDSAGTPLAARTYELAVNGGIPYERDVSPSPTNTGSVFHQMLRSRKQPKLILKLKSVNSRTKTQLSLLPDTLLFCRSSLHLLILHRQILADTLLLDRSTAQSADVLCSPLLASFPRLLDETDLLDALRIAWLDAESHMSRAQRVDLPHLKSRFTAVFLNAVLPLLHSSALPCQRWADPASEEQRQRIIFAALDALGSGSGSGSSQSGISPPCVASQRAFDVTELNFDLLRAAR